MKKNIKTKHDEFLPPIIDSARQWVRERELARQRERGVVEVPVAAVELLEWAGFDRNTGEEYCLLCEQTRHMLPDGESTGHLDDCPYTAIRSTLRGWRENK